MDRLKELMCVIFGHNWSESGEKTCPKHDAVYSKFETCHKCGLTRNIGEKLCPSCWIEFGQTLQMVGADSQQYIGSPLETMLR